jgi:predicted glycosyltransferase
VLYALSVYGTVVTTESATMFIDPALLGMASCFAAGGFIAFCTFEAGLCIPFSRGINCESGR